MIVPRISPPATSATRNKRYSATVSLISARLRSICKRLAREVLASICSRFCSMFGPGRWP